ncbi:hypothetical protein CEP54_014621 [Fusarium duplospermum]|uniref:Uncharacterized protein n=1 Tax=Fusarium duplospermum TaxID=1325734 RepID=A0A428NV00_9HYPO|nr:hypothetical protein CEP54_014621 [Fusarium duplospermum]
MGRFRRLFKRSTPPKEEKEEKEETKEKEGKGGKEEEEWASFMCRLVNKVVDDDNLGEVRRSVGEFIDKLHDGGKQMLINDLFTKLYTQEKRPRRCIPTTLPELIRVLDSFGTVDRDHPDINEIYNPFDVIYQMKESAKLRIDMHRVSEDNGLTIVAIMTGCLSAFFAKDCWPECVRATGLAVAERIQIYIGNQPPPCYAPLPPLPGSLPGARKRAEFQVGPDDDENKEG